MGRLPDTLPAGYAFVPEEAITASDIINLRDAGDWGTERNEELWERVLQESIATVGVCADDAPLVGVGFIAGNPRHAVLCDFIVHPAHRGKGIGRAILHRRINIADELAIPYLYTELSRTNSLRSRYEELGFVASGQLYSRAARRHPME